MPSKRRILGTLWLTCLAAAGCSDRSAEAPSRTDPDVQKAREETLARKEVAPAPPERPDAAASTGEVPEDVLGRIREDLARRTGGAPAAFEVVRAEAHEWPSGAMGCPQPGMNYTQAPVSGYWIVLRHGGRDYEYRVSDSGYFVTCEGVHREDAPTL